MNIARLLLSILLAVVGLGAFCFVVVVWCKWSVDGWDAGQHWKVVLSPVAAGILISVAAVTSLIYSMLSPPKKAEDESEEDD